MDQVYRPRKPQTSPLWKCLCRHFYDFVQAYPAAYEKKYGFLKPAFLGRGFYRGHYTASAFVLRDYGGQVYRKGWPARRSYLSEVGYSNRARGERSKKQAEETESSNPAGIQVIDVSDYQPRRLPSNSRPKGDRLSVFGQQRSVA